MNETPFTLKYTELKFTLKFISPAVLTPYKGTIIRGALGHGFRKSVCLYKLRDCHACPFREKCTYAYNFETIVTQDKPLLKNYRNAPHPFIIESPANHKKIYKEGDTLEFSIILLERGVSYYAYYINSFLEIETNGIGIRENKGKFKVITVKMGDSIIYKDGAFFPDNFNYKTITPEEDGEIHQITLNFITSTRLIENEKITLKPTFYTIIKSLLWRYTLLNVWHTEQVPNSEYYKELLLLSKQVLTLKSNLKETSIKRYSTRQQRYMTLKGFTGEIMFTGDISPFYPILKIGEIMHIGHNTSFGFGKYISETL